MRMDWIDNVKGPLNISYNFYCMKRILNNIHEKICKHSRRWIFVIKNTDLKLKSGQLLNIPLPTPSSWRVCFLFCQGDDLLQNKKKTISMVLHVCSVCDNWSPKVSRLAVLWPVSSPPLSLTYSRSMQNQHSPLVLHCMWWRSGAPAPAATGPRSKVLHHPLTKLKRNNLLALWRGCIFLDLTTARRSALMWS